MDSRARPQPPHEGSNSPDNGPAGALLSHHELLRQPGEFLETIAGKLPNALFYQAEHAPDGSYRFTYVSSGIEEFAGVSVEYALEHPQAVTDPIIEEDRTEFFAAIERSLHTLSPLDHVCRVRMADGSIRWSRFRSSVRPEPDGTVVCEGVEMDVTDAKLAEEALGAGDHANDLSRHEVARAARLAILGEIAASLTHELSQPLAAVVLNAQAARRFVDSGELNTEAMSDLLRDIAEQGKRAGDVIRRLRGWIDREQPPREAIGINQAIREVEHLLHSELVLRQIGVVTDLARDLPIVVVDRVQIQQVLVNLVLNAAEAMRDRSPSDRSLTVRTSERTGNVLVEVIDHGTGIPSAHRSRLFDAFFTTKPNGLGMGLRICASIVHAHGGEIWAENNDAGGATFYFTLPGEPA